VERELLVSFLMRNSTFLILALGMLAAGCSSSSSNVAGPSQSASSAALTVQQIAGTWTLVSIQPAGQGEQPVPAGAAYAVAFADGRASATADCNVCGGSLVVDGQTVTIGPMLACTLAACPTMAFENQYVAVLSGASAAQADSSSLTLTSSRGVLRFRR
jgi:heat shock protein HslJ